MVTTTAIELGTPWLRLEVDDADRKAIDPALHARMWEQIVAIRRFEEALLELKDAGLLHGPMHASIGQEAGAVGAMSVLGSTDRINGTHRAHHQFLTKLMNHAMPAGRDPRRDGWSEPMTDLAYRAMAEILGLRPGFCGGRGGSMHLRCDEAGVPGTSAIIGSNLPHAAGYAFTAKYRGTGDIAVSFFSDGTLMAGAAYEALNMAALYDLPVVFFLENNFYAVSTTIAEQTRETRLSSRGPLLGVPSVVADGMDPVAVRAAMAWARQRIEEDKGPVFVEIECYRFRHQHGPLPGSAFGYRSKEEEEAWLQRDPFTVYPRQLEELKLLTKKQIDAIAQRTSGEIAAIVDRLVETEPGSNARRVVPALWPDPASVESGLIGDGRELDGLKAREIDEVAPERLAPRRFVEVASAALARVMAADDAIVVIGEDIHRFRGGVTGVLRQSVQDFPDRICAMPICENGFTGMALGMALTGLHPVIEFMFPDFAVVAADQLFNNIAKVRHMYGGGFPLPVLVRTRVAAGLGFGAQHSMDASGLFSNWPGWRIVAPSNAYDYVGLLNAALASHDPVLLVEHVDLLASEGPAPADDDFDYIIPFGRARVARRGGAMTVLASLSTVGASIAAAEEAGIDAEVIDLRTLSYNDLDWRTIDASVRKTNRVLIAEETSSGPSLGPRIAQLCQERLFDWLDHPITRVAGTWSPPPVSKPLEAASFARKDKIAAAMKELSF